MKTGLLNIIFCVLIFQISIAQISNKSLDTDRLHISSNHKVDAYYKYGKAAFYEQIKELVTPHLTGIDFELYHSDIEFTGEVSTEGKILLSNYKSDINEVSALYLKEVLQKLPNLQPALVNDKPVVQKIEFRFRILSGYYRFGYRLLPLD